MRRSLARAITILAIVAAVLSLVFLRPEADYLLRELADHRAELADWIAGHFATAVIAFGAIYCVTKAAFLPTGPVLTAIGGLLLGITATTIAGSIGGALAAALLYAVAELGVGRGLRARAFPFVEKVGAGFRRYGFSYLVAFRLVPVVPFWVGCFVPAILGVRFGTYILATFVGSLPSIFLYASLGHGLGKALDQGGAPLDALSRPDIVGPHFGLAALSLAPVLWSKLRGRSARVV
jgi:uncharacterized membrane protein YdjX (TVP38/TMEM64 family)